jgi:hypothetical protein
VFDILGREIETLVNDERTPGSYAVDFDGSRLASGMYFCRLQSGRNVAVRKLSLVR